MTSTHEDKSDEEQYQKDPREQDQTGDIRASKTSTQTSEEDYASSSDSNSVSHSNSDAVTDSDSESEPQSTLIGKGRLENELDTPVTDILITLEEMIPRMLKLSDYSTRNCNGDFEYLDEQCIPPLQIRSIIYKKMFDLGIVELCLKAWNQLFWLDYTGTAWQNLDTVLLLMWNGSDISSQMCRKMADYYMPEMFFQHMSHANLDLSSVQLSTLTKTGKKVVKRKLRIWEGLLGTCHNIFQREALQNRCSKVGALEILKTNRKYIYQLGEKVSLVLDIVLAYIANDTESSNINSDGKFINIIAKIFADSLNSDDHFSRTYSFCAGEMALAMNKLAVVDENKHNIISAGGTELYLALLDPGCNEDEQTAAVNGLWILSFKKEGRDAIKNTPGCVTALNLLAKSSSSKVVKNAAKTTLWKLEEREEPVTTGLSCNVHGMAAKT